MLTGGAESSPIHAMILESTANDMPIMHLPTAAIATIASRTAMAVIAALNTRPSTVSGAWAQKTAIQGGCKNLAMLAMIAELGDSIQLRLHLDSLQSAVMIQADDPHWNQDAIEAWLYS